MCIKRVYDPPADRDGYRVLVDRLWPRGLSKSSAVLDEWLREIAPTSPLRTWFGHRPERLSEFRHRYLAELAGHEPLLQGLRERAARGRVTLLYAARDRKVNHAVVLEEAIRSGAVPPGAHRPTRPDRAD